MAIDLDLEGIVAFAGAACRSNAIEPSRILASLGLPAELVRGLCVSTLEERQPRRRQSERVLEVLPRIVARLRSVARTV